jgi:acyl-CoA synthetase (AMP-forming)/AMP-acid ligase II
MSRSNVVNIASHLPDMARRQGHRPAVIFPQSRDPQGRVAYVHYTYQQLDRASDAIARELGTLGIRPGVRTVLLVTPSLDFFALVFALFKVGAVMVCVDPGIGVRHLKQCLAEAQPSAFIGVSKAHWARRLLGWARDTLKTNIVVGPEKARSWGMITLAELQRCGSRSDEPVMAETLAADPAAILFTSGSTGVPKGVLYTHAHFDAQVRALGTQYGIEPGELDLNTFPLFALFAPALGMTSIIPDMDFTRPGSVDPRRLVEAIEDFGPTNMFGSPALLTRLGRWAAAREMRFPSLRRVISAGAPVPSHVLSTFARLLNEGAEVHTPFGATESLPVCSISSNEVLQETQTLTDRGQGVCVGRTVGDVEVSIIRITDEPLEEWSEALLRPQGEIGEIAVRGSVVTHAYYNRDQSTRLAKIPAPEGGVYHRMGDVGYLDPVGRLWFCGRKSHRVETANGTLFTIPCEAVFNTHPAVFRSALVGVQRGKRVEPVLCVELEADHRGDDPAQLIRELLALGAEVEHTRPIREILVHPGFPVDIRHNAKIGREQLAVWASGRLT